ncbi:MAG: DUF72 domain-containing protein [bacterium]
MEFGKVEPDLLRSVDHSLPESSFKTKALLKSLKTTSKTKVHFGCAKWGRKEWVGLVYPPKTKADDFLRKYSENFACIELNATFYKIYDEAKIKEWDEATGKGFLFCPKFYQGITHYHRLNNCDELTTSFLRSISAFDKKRGPCFLQLPNNFTTKKFADLQKYLLALPKDLEVFVELRHTDWFTTNFRDELYDFLSQNKFGWVITDTSGRRDCVHTELTIPKAFIRFVGNNIHSTDFPRIESWIKQIKVWQRTGIREIFFMMHQHDEKNTPIISEYLIRRLNEECGLKIPVPALLKKKIVKR